MQQPNETKENKVFAMAGHRRVIRVRKRDGRYEPLDVNKIHAVLRYTIEPKDINITEEDLMLVEMDAHIQFTDGISTSAIQQLLIRTAAEKISPEKPDYTYVAARLLLFDLYKRVNLIRSRKLKESTKSGYRLYKPYDAKTFAKHLPKYIEAGYYGQYLLDAYDLDFIERMYDKCIDAKYDLLFTYPGIKLLADRYLVRDSDNNVIELPQEMYFLIAMTLAIADIIYYAKNKLNIDTDYVDLRTLLSEIRKQYKSEVYQYVQYYIKQYYKLLASHKCTLATPTLMNARRPFTQLSSCFVLTVDDDLHNMYDNLQKMAQISKYAGGLGVYVGKIRSTGSSIQNKKGTSSGIIPYVKLINDTMTYVDQLGMRKGSASVTLDVWHKDILDFLEVKTNAGDERKKAHDIHPAISIPDLFMKRVKNKEQWTLFDPYEARLYIANKLITKALDTFRHQVQKTVELNDDKFVSDIVIKRTKQSAFAYDEIIDIEFVTERDLYVANIPDIVDKSFDPVFRRCQYIRIARNDFDIVSTENGDNKQYRHIIRLVVKYPGLEDFYGQEFENWYMELEQQLPEQAKRTVDAFELMKRIITVAFETGEPYIFFRDISNKLNPNKHIGVVYSSNLCHEIIQSMTVSKSLVSTDIYTDYSTIEQNCPNQFTDTANNIGRIAYTLNTFVYDTVRTNTEAYFEAKEPGIIPVCNLASINLGKIESDRDLEHILTYLVRMLDNVIELNFYAFYEIARTNKLFRAIGIGVSNYHYWLVRNAIRWESQEHIQAANRLFEKIAYYTVKASNELAKERGKYPLFDGSDWSKGILFGKTKEQLIEETKKSGNNLDWDKLVDSVVKYGLRNGYLLALMPTGSTSLIVGSTPSIDPIFAKFYKEENMSGILPQVPPEIDKYFWHYKTAYTIDHKWTILAAAERQKWIDQAQSLNLFIDPNNIDGPTLLSWYMLAWEKGLKTIYYLRSKSAFDIDECESCSA